MCLDAHAAETKRLERMRTCKVARGLAEPAIECVGRGPRGC